MNDENLERFENILISVANRSSTAWLYLPKNEDWSLSSIAAILESDEVPPELEDEPDAGVPEFAKRNNLQQTLAMTTVQDIISNLRAQKPDATIHDFLKAFQY